MVNTQLGLIFYMWLSCHCGRREMKPIPGADIGSESLREKKIIYIQGGRKKTGTRFCTP